MRQALKTTHTKEAVISRCSRLMDQTISSPDFTPEPSEPAAAAAAAARLAASRAHLPSSVQVGESSPDKSVISAPPPSSPKRVSYDQDKKNYFSVARGKNIAS